MTEAPQRASLPPALTNEEAAQLAARHGLRTSSERPPLGRYLSDLWQRRSFIWTLSSSESYAKNEDNRLGQVWAVLNPALLILSYYAIFGLLLGTDRGVDNFVGFLAIGVVMFTFTSSVITRGAKAITGNLSIVRALHFPRAVLPISSVVTELLEAAVSIALLLLIVPFTGDLPHLKWFLLFPALIIHAVIQLGFVLILARIVNMSADIWNLIPVATRLLRYVSGVFFSIAAVTKHRPNLYIALEYQPFALTLNLVRQAMLSEFAIDWRMWAAGVGYALLLPVVGLWIFWRDEAKYGRG